MSNEFTNQREPLTFNKKRVEKQRTKKSLLEGDRPVKQFKKPDNRAHILQGVRNRQTQKQQSQFMRAQANEASQSDDDLSSHPNNQVRLDLKQVDADQTHLPRVEKIVYDTPRNFLEPLNYSPLPGGPMVAHVGFNSSQAAPNSTAKEQLKQYTSYMDQEDVFSQSVPFLDIQDINDNIEDI